MFKVLRLECNHFYLNLKLFIQYVFHRRFPNFTSKTLPLFEILRIHPVRHLYKYVCRKSCVEDQLQYFENHFSLSGEDSFA